MWFVLDLIPVTVAVFTELLLFNAKVGISLWRDVFDVTCSGQLCQPFTKGWWVSLVYSVSSTNHKWSARKISEIYNYWKCP
jgi:hypothetical protein